MLGVRSRNQDHRRKSKKSNSFIRFRKDESGVYAIEFAMIAVPFFALIFAIIETGLVFFADSVLDHASSEAARLIRTGQAQQQGLSESAFKGQICTELKVPMFDCGKLHVDVRTYTQFDQVNLTDPLDNDGNLVANFNFNPGSGGDIVTARVFYEWPIIVNSFGINLADMSNGSRLLGSVHAFRNEPFPW